MPLVEPDFVVQYRQGRCFHLETNGESALQSQVLYRQNVENLTGRPAISVPFAFSNGLPIGIQLMADSMQDKQLFQAAYSLERCTDLQKVPTL